MVWRGSGPFLRGRSAAEPGRKDNKGCVLVRKLLRSIGVIAVLSMLGFGAGATSASAADPVADLRAFVEAGFHGTTDADYRAWAEVLAASTDSPVTHQAATDALAGTDEQLHAFVDGGYLAAWHADERLRLARVLDAATGPAVTAGVQAALASSDPAVWSAFLSTGLAQAQRADDRLEVARVLDAATGPAVRAAAQAALASSDPDAVSEFLATGLAQAQYADDRLMAATMLTGGANNSGPALDAAAQAALAGTPAELREFILHGQYTARALDAEAAAPAVPAAPPAPAAPADPPAAAPQPVQVAASPAASSNAAVLAATGSSAGAPVAALAATALLVGTGLVLVRRRRQA